TLPRVTEMLNDESPRVRANAARFISGGNLESNLSVLAKMVESDDLHQVRCAKFALFWIRDERARNLVTRACEILGEPLSPDAED
ncbi:MAG: HEAT repeat domain-containing protein, partial [Candidatus Wallbacteria bacterium]|nr:HEAT repeat domain-containing protein [Candidatus Wallbacteria bacterium]